MTRKATAQKPADEQEFITAEEYEQQGIAPVVPLAFANTLRTLKSARRPEAHQDARGLARPQRQPAHGRVRRVAHGRRHPRPRRARTGRTRFAASSRSATWSPSPVAITIDGVTREGVGTGTADNETGIKKAEHDALKRAAIKFGIARELYQRESESSSTTGAGPSARRRSRATRSRSLWQTS